MPGFQPMRVWAAALAVCAVTGTPAAAGPVNLVTNGSFDDPGTVIGQFAYGKSGIDTTRGNQQYATAPGWGADPSYSGSNAGYPFLFIAAPYGSASSPTDFWFYDPWDRARRSLWGNYASGGNINNGFNGTSPDGGNFLVMDADYHATPIQQTLTGLTRGTVYSVTFSYAAAQWNQNTGPTTETMQVSLGGQSRRTTTINLPSQGFSGWLSQTFSFTYDGTSPTLSFLAIGTPSGAPPMLLLDGITLYDIPEPAAAFGLLSGCAVLARVRRRRLTRTI